MLGEYSLRLPFIAAAGLSFINLCFGLFLLPESLAAANRRAMTWARATPFKLLIGVAHDAALRRLAIAWSCTWIGLGAVQSSLVLFMTFRYGWGPMLSGLVLAGVGLSQTVVEGLLLRHITARIGERSTAIAGYVAGAAGYGVLALAFAGWTMVPAVILIALGGLATPSIRAMVAGRGGVDSQGEMQGLLSAVEGSDGRVRAAAHGGIVLRVYHPPAPGDISRGAVCFRRRRGCGGRQLDPGAVTLPDVADGSRSQPFSQET